MDNITVNENELVNSRECSVLAIRLAITQTDREEERVKAQIAAKGYVCCVTRVGGTVQAWKEKAIGNVLGACLHSGVIDKTSREVHGLLHALAEAEKGLLLDSPLVSSMAVKVCVLRSDRWIYTVMFGDCAMHKLSHHDRMGFGIMHI